MLLEITNYLFFTNKNNFEILKEAKKISNAQDSTPDSETYVAKLITDDKSKVLKEKIYLGGTSSNDELCTLINTNAKIKANDKTYYGYNVKADGDKGLLISNSGKQVTFDNDKQITLNK